MCCGLDGDLIPGPLACHFVPFVVVVINWILRK